MSWKNNSIMWWYSGAVWNKISDHNRSPLNVSVDRIESSTRMANGTLRRYVVAKKRTWDLSWQNFPSRSNPTRDGVQGIGTIDGGWAGEDIENFHNTNDGAFLIRVKGGDDIGVDVSDNSVEEYMVMITDFSKEITKRGVVDLWSLDITLTEV